MEQAVNGSGGELQREPIVDTKKQWTCAECDTANIVNDGDDTEIANSCSECGAVRHEEELEDVDADTDAFGADDLSVDDIKAGLQNLSGGIATSQDVENAARAEEGLPPLEAAGLLDFGPFNPDNALKAIFEKSAEVRELQADYDRKKESASEAKKELDVASKALVNIIESLKNRRTQALNPSQPYLKDVSGDAPAPSLSTSRCPWERDHPGQSCPICTAAQAKDLIPALESEVHPEHEGHAAVAEAARVKNVLEPLAAKLANVHIFVTADDLAPLSKDDLDALELYATEPSPIPPHVLVKSCVAAEPGSMIQVCQRCERILRNDVENTPERGWYAVDVRVGLACEAALPESVQVVTSEHHAEIHGAEGDVAPRKPRSHAKKNKARKPAPEVERQAQTAEGRKRRASDQPKAKKAKSAKRGKH